MNIAYFMKNEADIAKLAPGDAQWIKVSARPDGTYAPDDLRKLADVEAILVWTEIITPAVLAAAPKLKIIQRFGAGFDVLAPVLELTRERLIPCCNVEGVNKVAVGEHGMLLMLAVARQLNVVQEHTRAARWPRELRPDIPPFELDGKTLGIIGLGNTGMELAKRAKAFDMRIVYNDVRTLDPARIKSVDATFMEKDELFRQADVISINTDLNPTSRTMIDTRTIGLMKRTAVVICCARGGIIDEVALRDALNSDRIAGAGLDVYSPEPIRADNPLLSAKNCVLTPHVAGVTRESIARSYDWAHENVRRVVQRNEAPRWVVNGVK
ncbi:MAG: NAD(P)-dependent oxidoreductase [Burkholderiales bacterium]